MLIDYYRSFLALDNFRQNLIYGKLLFKVDLDNSIF